MLVLQIAEVDERLVSRLEFSYGLLALLTLHRFAEVLTKTNIQITRIIT